MLQLHRKTSMKVIHITPLAMKAGAKDVIPGLSFRLEGTIPNTELDQLDPMLRTLLFQKAPSPNVRKEAQEKLEGMAAFEGVDLPSLKTTAAKLCTFEWNEEQTGCTMTVDRGGEGGPNNVKLTGCIAKKLQLTALEGGAVKFRYTVNTNPTDELDDETHGYLAKLKKRSVGITLIGPQVDPAQQQIPAGAALTPIGSLEAAVEAGVAAGEAGDAKPQGEAAWPFPKEQAAKKPRSAATAH